MHEAPTTTRLPRCVSFSSNMAATTGGLLIRGVCAAYAQRHGLPTTSYQIRAYAARKGTREKARKAKVKVEVKKIGFIPHEQRVSAKDKQRLASKRIEDMWKPVSPDNVWMAKFYQWRVFPFAEAVECHRETHHPTVGNSPNSHLLAFIELDMKGEKKNKFVDSFNRMVGIPHPFRFDRERKVLALCKGEDLHQLALEAGATLAGGPEIAKEIMAGNISLEEYDYVVAHPHILPEITTLRGLMKKKYPSIKAGNLDKDIIDTVKKFAFGIDYKAVKDVFEEDYGTIKTPVGTLDMDPAHLEANFSALVNDVHSRKPKREGPFITRTLLITEASVEKLKVDYTKYLPQIMDNQSRKDEDENDAKDEEEDNEYEPHTVAASSPF